MTKATFYHILRDLVKMDIKKLKSYVFVCKVVGFINFEWLSQVNFFLFKYEPLIREKKSLINNNATEEIVFMMEGGDKYRAASIYFCQKIVEGLSVLWGLSWRSLHILYYMFAGDRMNFLIISKFLGWRIEGEKWQ